MAFVLLAGCSSSDGGNEAFNAEAFVNECRILVPASAYKNSSVSDFEMLFTKTVFEQFCESDYYKAMSDSERETAANEIGNVLLTYSYGNVSGGFIDSIEVDMNLHSIRWHNIHAEYSMECPMPGY